MLILVIYTILSFYFFVTGSYTYLALAFLFSPLLAVIDLIFLASLNKHLFKPFKEDLWAFSWSVVIFFSFCFFFFYFDFHQTGFQFYNSFEFEGSLSGLTYSFGWDVISFLFVGLTAYLFPIVFLSLWFLDFDNKIFFYILLFLTQFFLFNVFSVLDVFLFYIFFEAIIIPMFLIIGMWGGRAQKIYSAYLFFYYTLVGSVGMLIAILYIYMVVGSTSYLIILNFNFTYLEQLLLFLAFFISFSAKLPVYPFHIWLPEAHVEAPTAGSVLLAGVLLKMGGYGIIRWIFPFFPLAIETFSSFVNVLAVLSILYASFSALQQLDVKRIVAYSSVAHMAYVLIGLFSFTVEGFTGAVFSMLTHGFIASGLFLSIGVLYDRYGTRSLIYYGGLNLLMPIFDSFVFIFFLANMAMPGTAGFPGEFLILLGVFKNTPFISLFLFIGVFLTGVYTIWTYSRLMLGQVHESFVIKYSDLTLRETGILISLTVFVFGFGLFPSFILRAISIWFINN